MQTQIPIGEATAARIARAHPPADHATNPVAAFMENPPGWFFVATLAISAACLVFILH